jgi:hypothetical protein
MEQLFIMKMTKSFILESDYDNSGLSDPWYTRDFRQAIGAERQPE